MSRPDEGMIHAWLDGELEAAESARIEALVRDDAEWAAAAAEARGFIAASARIVGALDHVPANVIPKAAIAASNAAQPAGAKPLRQASRPTRGAPWWAMRAAALLVIAAGVAVVARQDPNSSLSTTAVDAAKSGTAALPVNEPTRAPAAPANEADAAMKRVATAPTATGATAATATTAAPKQSGERLAPSAPLAAPPAATAVAPRDRLDERRVGSADATAGASAGVAAGSRAVEGKLKEETRSTDLKKDAAPALKSSVAELSAAATTAFADAPSPRKMERAEACYIERAASGAESIVYRVTLINDSTVAAVAPAGQRLESSAARARQAAVAGSGQAAPSAPPSAIQLKTHGDTLFLPGPRTTLRTELRVALKVTCPPQ